MTKIQKFTLILLVLYGIWEIAVYIWSKNLPPNDPLIRADLILIYPLLIIMIIISIVQLIFSWKRKNSDN
ncbi:MAG TPA: hypothetical protein PK536_01305 [Ignavibacteria bacterium]|nr:hypothetical protein [Ignavibacteria bacterium]HRK00389.1 hypothetical protein [Ignavibacteria bacterium]